jgi:hypothetical protein
MKKTTYLLLATTVFMVLFASACGGSAAPATQAAPPVEVVPTQPAPEAAPVDAGAPAQTFAPACQAASACAAPAVVDTVASDRVCVKKIPYQYIFVDDGVTFEVLEPDKLICVDNGGVSSDGKHAIECHGTESWASQVKFTNTACSAASLTAGSDQCQAGLGYDAAQNCCAPLTAGDAGSVTITVNMGECIN